MELHKDVRNVGIIGASGFAGEELIRFLDSHSYSSILAVSSRAVSYTHLTLPTKS